MCVLEYHRVFLADASQTVDAEESTVANNPVLPVHQAIGLAIMYFLRGAVFGARAHRECIVVVAQKWLVARGVELQLVDIFRGAQNRQPHLAVGTVVLVPVDVEVWLELRILAIGQNVPPPGIELGLLNTEVVRYQVDNDAQTGLVRHLRELLQLFHAAELRVHRRRIDDIVAMVRLRYGGEDRRQIQV